MPWVEPAGGSLKENFDGALGNLNTGNWAAWVTANPNMRNGSGLLRVGGSDAYSGSRRTDTHPANVRLMLELRHDHTAIGSQYWGFAFGFTAENADTGDGYLIGHSGNNATLYERLNGGDAQLGSQWAYNYAVGHRIGVQRDGSSIEVYYGAVGAMTLRISATDATYGIGRHAVDIYDPGADNLFFDNLFWEEIVVAGGVNVNASMSTSASASSVYARRKGVSRALASSAQATATASHRKAVSRSSATGGQAVTTIAKTKGISRSTSTSAQAVASTIRIKGVARSMSASMQAESSSAYIKGVNRSLTTSADVTTNFVTELAAFNVDAQMAVSAAADSGWSARKGVLRSLVSEASSASSFTRRFGAVKSLQSTARAEVAFTRQIGAVKRMQVAGRGETGFGHQVGVSRALSATAIATVTFTILDETPGVGSPGHIGVVLPGKPGYDSPGSFTYQSPGYVS